MNDSNRIFWDESYKIVGAAKEVYRNLGSGFTEAVYQEAMEIEMKNQGIAFIREQSLSIEYKGFKLQKTFRVDFVCYNGIILELKAISELNDECYAQIYNYLKASGMNLGLLINFGNTGFEHKRVIRRKEWDIPHYTNQF